MGRCKDCKWWDTPTRWATYEDFGECLLAETNDYTLDHPESLARTTVEDNCGGGSLYTKPDFGCVQFEAKE